MKFFALSIALVLAPTLTAQTISNPAASVLDVSARQTLVSNTKELLIQQAVTQLKSCTATPVVSAPTGAMQIPNHYLSGSSGPVNPAEASAQKPYTDFEHRISYGMNRWVATGNEAEAQCALSQLDAWGQAGALTNYDPTAYPESWSQAGWSLSSAGVVASVLRQDSSLDAAQQERVANWLQGAAHKLISYEKTGALGNNLHYWRALAATSIGVLSNDNALFDFGVNTYKQAVSQVDQNGAFPLEMARASNAIHYQAFALEPLIMIAEFGERQNVDLYSVTANGRTIRNAVVFLGKAIASPSIVKQYTNSTQTMDFSAGDVAEFEFYFARFGTSGISSALTNLLNTPADDKNIGGNMTVLAAK